MINFFTGKNIDVLKKHFPDNYFSAVVADAPYGMGEEPDIVEVMKAWIETGYHEVKGKGFMGKEWDAFVPQPIVWKEIYRVLKPGGYMLVACGTRTQDWMVSSIRFAGFEIRDVIAHHYGSGFPKSLNVSAAIDEKLWSNFLKEQHPEELTIIKNLPKEKRDEYIDALQEKYGFKREVLDRKETKSGGMANVNKVNEQQGFRPNNYNEDGNIFETTAPATDEAEQWEGWGTAIKPATELYTLCRKPLSEKTIAENVLKHGTGGLNIDATRIPTNPDIDDKRLGGAGSFKTDKAAKNVYEGGYEGKDIASSALGRFPANVVFSHAEDCKCVGTEKVKGTCSGNGNAAEGVKSAGAVPPLRRGKFTDRTDEDGFEETEKWECVEGCPVRMLNEQSGNLKSGAMKKSYTYQNNGFSIGKPTGVTKQIHGASEGGASRFFYCAKPSKAERNKGLENFEKKDNTHASYGIHTDEGLIHNGRNPENRSRQVANFHPTVKSIGLMKYMVQLITPPGGIVLDPFAGSCTTGCACEVLGIDAVMIDQEADYIEIGKARVAAWKKEEPSNQISLFEENP